MRRSLVPGLILLGAMTLARSEIAADPSDPTAVNSPAKDDQALIVDTDTSPYHEALLDYKSGKYEEAHAAIDVAERAKPGDLATEVLKARILTEQHEFADGDKLLRSLLAGNSLDANGTYEVQLALADLLLRKRSFDGATKYYSLALQAKPNDPDITLKLIYAKIGANDMVGAGQLASHLSPIDAKNPYDDHASYYFARAALAQSAGNSQEAEEDIQTARTIYGIRVSNRYLKTYLEVFASNQKSPASDITPGPLGKPAPSGAK